MLKLRSYICTNPYCISIRQVASGAKGKKAPEPLDSEENLIRGAPVTNVAGRRYRKDVTPKKSFPLDFRFAFPEFLPNPVYTWRHPLKEKLERMDMLRRRQVLEIPEFYVGSILAVTVTERAAPGKVNKFVGICIDKEGFGLKHTFTLRNVIDGLGMEIKYDMYCPLIRKIEVLKLEKRVDPNLRYLRDALPEYSTIPFDMEPIPHPLGAPVPINKMQVRMKKMPWSERWDVLRDQYEGISLEDQNTISQNRKVLAIMTPYQIKMMEMSRIARLRMQNDIMKEYRQNIPADEQYKIYDEILEHQKKIQKDKGRRHKLFTYKGAQLGLDDTK